MRIEIRQAESSDVDRLKALSRRTIEESYVPFLGDEVVENYIASGAVDQYVENHIQNCCVILAADVLAGFSVCKRNLIDLMMIDRKYQRQGLGTRLLKFVEYVLFTSFDELKLESFEPNSQANSFYTKNGWVGGETYLDDDSGVNKILFTKKA